MRRTEALGRWLAEAVDLRTSVRSSWTRGRQGGTHGTQVVEDVKLGGKAAVDAEELLIEDGGERQRAERLGTGVVEAFRVLVLACTGHRQNIVSGSAKTHIRA
jgi:hypothetical protein